MNRNIWQLSTLATVLMLAFASVLMMNPSAAKADIIVSQTNATTSQNNCPNNVCQQGLGNGLEGYIDLVTFHGSRIVGFDQFNIGAIWEFSNASATATSTSCGATLNTTPGGETNTFTNEQALATTSTVTWGATVEDHDYVYPQVQLKPECYYWVGTIRESGGGITIYGSTVGTDYANGSFHGGIDSLKDLAFSVEGVAVAVEQQTNSRFTNLFAPPQFYVANSQEVTVQQQYYNSGIEGYDRVGIILTNMTTGNKVTVPSQPISGVGFGLFDDDLLLAASTTYHWQPVMFKQDELVGTSGGTLGGSILDGSILNGGVLSTTTVPELVGSTKRFTTSSVYSWTDSAIFNAEGSPLGDGAILGTLPENLTDGNATSTLVSQLTTGFAILDALGTKFPFNWMIGGAVILSSLQNEVSTTSLPEMSVDFGYLRSLQRVGTSTATTTPNWTIAYIGQDDFDRVAAFTPIILARQMCVYILWIGLFFFVIKEAMGVFSSRTSREYDETIYDSYHPSSRPQGMNQGSTIRQL